MAQITQVAVVQGTKIADFEKSLNDTLKELSGNLIVDIKYNTLCTEQSLIYSALIIYK